MKRDERRAWGLSRLVRARGGTTALEFALVGPVFILLVTGAMGIGTALWKRSAMQYAVQQAARCAAVDPVQCGTTAQIQAYAASLATAQGIPSDAFSATTAACGQQVSASLDFNFMPRPLPSRVLTLTAVSCHPT